MCIFHMLYIDWHLFSHILPEWPLYHVWYLPSLFGLDFQLIRFSIQWIIACFPFHFILYSKNLQANSKSITIQVVVSMIIVLAFGPNKPSQVLIVQLSYQVMMLIMDISIIYIYVFFLYIYLHISRANISIDYKRLYLW